MANSHRQLKALMSDIDGIYGLPMRPQKIAELQLFWCRLDQPPATSE
jgi:hypothetical protein